MKKKTIPVTERDWYKKWYNNLSPQEKAIEDRERGIRIAKPTVKKDIIKIYTDGCCIGNPGKGGYGVIIKHNEDEYVLSCGFERTTNNRMELKAVIDSLYFVGENIGEADEVHIYSDSRYVTDAINKGWLKNWVKFGYKKNKDLWVIMNELYDSFTPVFHWVRGHNGHIENERCDKIAKEATKSKHLIPDVIDNPKTVGTIDEDCNKFRGKLRELGEYFMHPIPDSVIKTYLNGHTNFIDAVHAFIRKNTLK